MADAGHIPTPEQFRELGPRWEAGWIAGCHAEAAAHNEGLSPDARAVRDLLEAFARHPVWGQADKAELAGLLFRIETAGMPWWRQLRLIWRRP
jgi:hypothetical protein